ncbi:MAG: hypothetical protein JHC73_08250 [Dolichospermum sp.]|nr:hypothetical protein [Dolichospermum sp.]
MMSTKRERSPFRNKLGERSFKIRVVSDTAGADLSVRCLGMWGAIV